ncbi:MAG: GntR family transcriptional regulator [Casimicrobiaceae bacterium]
MKSSQTPRAGARAAQEAARASSVQPTPAGAGRPPSLSDRAYEQIKQKILSLEFGPGQFLNEMGIASMLGLGRTPVHQAVHRLKGDGLLDVIPRKCILVRPDSLNEVLELIEARLAVEPGIAALAAERVTPDQVAGIRALLSRSGRITHQKHRQQFMAIDRAFHGLVAGGAGNAILAEAIRPMHERSTRIWHLQVWQADDLVVTQAEHEAILDAIARRDKSGAARAMQQHLASLRRRIVRGR